MRRCRNCLCSKCMNTCFKNVNSCKNYKPFEQMRLFMQQKKKKSKAAPRASWSYYGLTDKRYRKKLKQMMQSSKYASLARSAAYTANKDIAEYLLLSVKQNLSYEDIEYADGLDRIPCGRTDFYGYRRLLYHLFNLELRKEVQNGCYCK